MEYILMALFGGGYADWQDISQTEYDWEKIFAEAESEYGDLSNIEINDLYSMILDMAIRDFGDMIEEFIEEYKTDENYKADIEVLEDYDFRDYSNWNTWVNCLDTHITLYVTEEVNNILENVLEDKINEIDDKIGFTYINREITK